MKLDEKILNLVNDPVIDAIVYASRHSVPIAVLSLDGNILILGRMGESPSSNRFRLFDRKGNDVFKGKPFWGLFSVSYMLSAAGWKNCRLDPVNGSIPTAKKLAKLLEERDPLE